MEILNKREAKKLAQNAKYITHTQYSEWEPETKKTVTFKQMLEVLEKAFGNWRASKDGCEVRISNKVDSFKFCV